MRHVWRAVVAFSLVPLSWACTAVRPPVFEYPDSNQQSSLLAQARRVLEAGVGPDGVGSAVGLIARRDHVLLLASAGELGDRQPMTVNAIARIASIQKPITAAAVLMLAEEGKLSLTDPVTRWLPGFGSRVLAQSGDTVASGQPATVFHLLTHQAGVIPGGAELDALWESASTQEFARGIARIPLRFQPGERYEYGCCGAAYEVLAAIVEQVSGMNFKEFLTTRILRPLRMEDTYFFVPPQKQTRLAAHYGRRNGQLVAVRPRGLESPETAFYAGGGSLRSTVLDYYRFILMLLNEGELDGARVLRRETVRMMLSDQVGAKYPAAGYGWGFGMRIRTGEAADVPVRPGTFGWNGGTGTQFEADPRSGRIVIVFAPTWPGTPGVSEFRDRFVAAARNAVPR